MFCPYKRIIFLVIISPIRTELLKLFQDITTLVIWINQDFHSWSQQMNLSADKILECEVGFQEVFNWIFFYV
jgi:hypothetical protein